ncbi:MAG TPA: hypothetical protein VIM41_08675 [Gammaproteobacteria bacterium]
MQIDVSRECWKIKVHGGVAEFLKHPSAARKIQLLTALTEYEKIFNHGADCNKSSFSELELAMNDY